MTTYLLSHLKHKAVTRLAGSLAQDRQRSPAETSVLSTKLRLQRPVLNAILCSLDHFDQNTTDIRYKHFCENSHIKLYYTAPFLLKNLLKLVKILLTNVLRLRSRTALQPRRKRKQLSVST